MKSLFDCDGIGELHEHVGYKVGYNAEKKKFKFTQSVLWRSYLEEFKLPSYKYMSKAEPRQILPAPLVGQELDNDRQSKFRTGVGKMLYMMRWSRPEI